MENKEGLQLELGTVYEELAQVAARQRALTLERETLEEQRDFLLYQLGKISTGAKYDVC